MFDDKFKEVVSKEGVVSIVSCADNEAHVVNTWNSYLVLADEARILLPAWAMRKTEKKVDKNPHVLLTLGSKEVAGRMGQGTGFLVTGTARFVSSGPEFAMMKEKFSFLTRVLEVTVSSVKQTI
ncbi:MAG: pyridoxamine 5'-phosphate oxidase family protein [Desulforhopalus sp.]|nr:pyridoxamine 5'-phosphate oxidase family protein [Desulforhopalus sp.]